jgi:hypothetical protein
MTVNLTMLEMKRTAGISGDSDGRESPSMERAGRLGRYREHLLFPYLV